MLHNSKENILTIKFLLAFSTFLIPISSIYANCVDDPEELAQYVAAFPEKEYAACNIPGQGVFYIQPFKHDLIKNILRSGQLWEPHILRVIHQYTKPGTIALDIGAYIGTFTIAMSQAVGDSGTVYAFEPQRIIFRELKKNCELNGAKNVISHRIALGDRPAIVEMQESIGSDNEGGTPIGSGGDLTEMRTVDSFHLRNVSFIKIDVERSEDEVLDGMVLTLRNNKPVIAIEIQGGYAWETAPPDIKQKIQNTFNKLQALGYRVEPLTGHDYLAFPLLLF